MSRDTLIMTQHSLLPVLRCAYTDNNKVPAPLTGLTITLQIAKGDTVLILTPEIIDEAGGLFQFPWTVASTADAGTFRCNILMVDGNGLPEYTEVFDLNVRAGL